ncbi:hypothetical protein [Enterococcus casseliflavus]|nr:hypothetical protein [Enterococcus casseliflavus]
MKNHKAVCRSDSESIEPLPYKEKKNTRYRTKRMPLVTSIFRQSSLTS